MINYKWLTIPYASTHPFYLHQLLSFTSKQLQKFVKNYMLLDFATADTNYLVQQPTRSIHYFIPELPQRSRELSWQRCSSSSLFSPRRKKKKTKKQKRKTCFVPVGIANVSLSYWSLLFFFPPKNQFLPSIHKPSLYVTVSLSFLLSVVIGWSLVMDMEIHKFDTGGDLSDTTNKSIDHWSKSTNVHPRPRSGPWHSLPLFAPIFPPLLLTFAAPRYPSLSLFSLINFR